MTNHLLWNIIVKEALQRWIATNDSMKEKNNKLIIAYEKRDLAS